MIYICKQNTPYFEGLDWLTAMAKFLSDHAGHQAYMKGSILCVPINSKRGADELFSAIHSVAPFPLKRIPAEEFAPPKEDGP